MPPTSSSYTMEWIYAKSYPRTCLTNRGKEEEEGELNENYVKRVNYKLSNGPSYLMSLIPKPSEKTIALSIYRSGV